MKKHAMPPVVLAFGGGKGGTGKSLLSVQLGILLAHKGLHCTLVDADPNGANINTFFGLEGPERSLDEVLRGQCLPVDAVLPSGIPRLSLLPGFREGMADSLDWESRSAWIKKLRGLPGDVLLWDLGSGMRNWSTHLFSSADIGLMITAPEAIAMERDYRFLRRVCRWSIQDLLPQDLALPQEWLPRPWLVQLRQENPELAQQLSGRLQQQRLLWILNGVRTPEDRSLGSEVVSVCRRFLGVNGQSLGWLEFDDRLWLSLRHRRPSILEFPESRWTEQVHQIFQSLLPLVLQHKNL